MQMKLIKDRYESFDFLKAMAIFMVVIYHCNNLKPDLTVNQDGLSLLYYFAQSILSACVPIFFFVNGALLLNKEFNLKSHLFKLLKMGLLTVAWGIITLLLLMPINNEFMTLSEFSKNVLKLKTDWNDHLWFLQAMTVIYVFFPLLKTTFVHNRNQVIFFLSFAFLMTFGNAFLSAGVNVIGLITGKNSVVENRNFFFDFNAFRGIYGFSFVYFILGGFFFGMRDKFRSKKWVMLAAAGILISMLLLTAYGVIMSRYYGIDFDIVWNGYDTIPTFLMVLGFAILSLQYRGTGKISKLVNAIGRNSLGIYFVHRIWGLQLLKYFKEIPYSHSLVANIIFSGFITILSLFTVLLLKRIPIVRRLFII